MVLILVITGTAQLIYRWAPKAIIRPIPVSPIPGLTEPLFAPLLSYTPLASALLSELVGVELLM